MRGQALMALGVLVGPPNKDLGLAGRLAGWVVGRAGDGSDSNELKGPGGSATQRPEASWRAAWLAGWLAGWLARWLAWDLADGDQ